MSDITRILTAIDEGDTRAVDELLPAVYQEPRQLAARKLAREKPGQTLRPTALVHEAYLRLVGAEGRSWKGKTRFFAAAAKAMRRILTENAQHKGRLKRGAGRQRIDLDEVQTDVEDPSADVLALDEARAKLEATNKVKVDLVKLRYFAGLTVEQATEVLGISERTSEVRRIAPAR